MTKFNEDSL